MLLCYAQDGSESFRYLLWSWEAAAAWIWGPGTFRTAWALVKSSKGSQPAQEGMPHKQTSNSLP